MSITPFQERVYAERDQLSHRVIKLRAFIGSDTFRQVDKEERRRLVRQEVIMTEFIDVLTERIEAFAAATKTDPKPSDDFALGKACDLSGEGACESCQ